MSKSAVVWRIVCESIFSFSFYLGVLIAFQLQLWVIYTKCIQELAENDVMDKIENEWVFTQGSRKS